MTHRVRPPIRRAAFAAAAAIIAAVLVPVPAGADPGPPGIEWEMVDRFGVDADRDGRVDLPNTGAYVAGAAPSECRPSCPRAAFPVRLWATLGGRVPSAMVPAVEYQWTIEPRDGPAIRISRYSPEAVVRLPEGPAAIGLRIVVGTPFGSFGATARETIHVDDILVVALGDSYASGEGNPEQHRAAGPVLWGDGLGYSDGDHAAARRSAIAWPAQVALDLERSDPHTSVTFVTLAASGATIDEGLLGPQNGSLPSPQVEAAARLVGERDVDLLLVSIGGNDIGFSRIIAGLVDADPWLDPICYDTDLDNVWGAAEDGVWDRSSRLTWDPHRPWRIGCRTARDGGGTRLAGLAGLPGELDRLAEALRQSLAPARVVVAEYPDPTGRPDGAGTCDEIVGDAAPFGLHEIDRDEQRLGTRRVLDPLNLSIRAAAERLGWVYAGGVAAAFAQGHGYCASRPSYEPPGSAGAAADPDAPDSWYRNGHLRGTARLEGPYSWYRTAGQSTALQGPDSRIDTTGTMHPNELGHRAIADLVLAALEGP